MEGAALGLLVLGVLLAEPVSRSLARAHWPVRDPVGALLVWQAVGLAGGLALLGSGVVYGLSPLGPTLPAALRDALDPPAVRAVLAHERAHLRERHDLVVLPFVAWGATAPFVRGMVCAQVAVAALIEMRADDVAAARVAPAELA